jgi:hypothetical protein
LGACGQDYGCAEGGSVRFSDSALKSVDVQTPGELPMNDAQIKDWLDSYSMGVLDRRGRPVRNRDVEGMLKDKEYRTVGDETFLVGGASVRVSTVFLGLPHVKSLLNDRFALWETMIFGGEYDRWQHRWDSAAIASKMHAHPDFWRRRR